ncbi:MAG TPA: NUDIX domain-containing protein [Chitinophagaceae bacterium]|nr:NUDIX domain-containing protein [Chitinophagaceae bacterium]
MEKIIAAGGLISNGNNELLMIFRRGKWDLPKGKLDEGERIEDCALREVKEETGLKEVTLGKFIGITEHEYFNTYTNHDVIKETHWYAMSAAREQKLIPQTTEDIEEIEWVRKEILEIYLNNSYPNIVDIVNKYLQQ